MFCEHECTNISPRLINVSRWLYFGGHCIILVPRLSSTVSIQEQISLQKVLVHFEQGDSLHVFNIKQMGTISHVLNFLYFTRERKIVISVLR